MLERCANEGGWKVAITCEYPSKGCAACTEHHGRVFEIDEVPEIPLRECVCENRGQCSYTPVKAE